MTGKLKCPYCHEYVQDHGEMVVCRTQGCWNCDETRTKVRIESAVINHPQKENTMKFIGDNVLVLCKSDMRKAMEHWLNTVVFKVPVSVTNISKRKQDAHDESFSIDFKTAPPEFED